MWKLILAGCLLAAHCFAAAPTLYTPWRAFRGTGGIIISTNPVAVTVDVDGSAFALVSEQIWTNDAGTVYLVPTDVFEVFTTNLNNEGVLYSLGPLTLGSTSQILSLGTNDVDTSQQSDRVMTSPTNNAALVTLRLSPPTVGAQLLFISNGDTNTAWTFVDGQTNTTGGGAADLQGDFVANAPGIGLLLKAAGEDWIEIGRFDPGGLAPGGMNPTDLFLPFRSNATTFADSPLLKNTNQPGVQLNGGLFFFGTGTTNAAITNGPTSQSLYLVAGDGSSYGNLYLGELNVDEKFMPQLNESSFAGAGVIVSSIPVIQPVNGLRGTTNSVILAGVPTIADGTISGHMKWLLGRGSSTNTVTVQSESVLPGSNLLLKSGTRTIGLGDVLTLMWDTFLGAWTEVSFSVANAPVGINPTDGFIPVRGSATEFTNSPFFVTQTGHATMTNINGNTTLITFKSTNSAQQVRVGLTAAGAGLLEGTDGIAITSTGGSSVGIAQGGFQLFFLNGTLYAASNTVHLGGADVPFIDLFLGTNSLFLGTNVYTDNGSSLLRNGVAVGGGGSGPSFADLVWTNTGTFIQPTGIGANTNAILIYPQGNLIVGTNTVSIYENQYNDIGAESLVSIRNNLLELETGKNIIHIGTSDGTNYSLFEATTDVGKSQLKIFGDGLNGLNFYHDLANTLIELNAVGQVVTRLAPTATSAQTPYSFDTSTAHTSGNLNEWKNLGVTHLSLASTNGISTPAITAYGAGSAPWQFGMATNTVDVLLRATNMVEITVNGVAYYLPAALK